MKVNLAVQIFSESVAKGIENVIQAGYFNTPSLLNLAKSTITFVRNMNILFDLLNSKDPNDKNNNKRGISNNNIEQLKYLYKYSLTVKKNRRIYCLLDLRSPANIVCCNWIV